MKKRLVLLPFIGAFLLAGCELQIGSLHIGGDKKSNNEAEKQTQPEGEGQKQEGEKEGEGEGTKVEDFVLDFTDPAWKDDQVTPYISETDDMGVLKTFTYQDMEFNDVGCYASAGYNGASNYLMMKNTKYGSSKDQYSTVPAFFGNKTAFDQPIKKVEVQVEGSSSSANCIYRVAIGKAAVAEPVTSGGATGKKGQTFSTTSTDKDAFYFSVSTNKTSDGKIYNGQLLKVTVSF